MVPKAQFAVPPDTATAAAVVKSCIGFVIGFSLGAAVCGIAITAMIVGTVYLSPLSGTAYVMLRDVMVAASIGAGIGTGSWTSKRFRNKEFHFIDRLRRFVIGSKPFREIDGHADVANDLMEVCTNQIAGSWLEYNKVLKFKPEVTWAEILCGFALPMRAFVEQNYPALYAGGPHLFLHMLYRGVQRTRWPSLDEINAAIAEADKKLTTDFVRATTH